MFVETEILIWSLQTVLSISFFPCWPMLWCQKSADRKILQYIERCTAECLPVEKCFCPHIDVKYHFKCFILVNVYLIFFVHQGCIYLIKNTVQFLYKCEILLQFKMTFLYKYILKCNIFLRSKWNFQHHDSIRQCHMILQKSMLICWSRNISNYYQCWKQLCCFIFLWNFCGIF